MSVLRRSVRLLGMTPGTVQVFTTETVAAHRVKRVLGVVTGSTVRTRNVVNDLFSSMKAVVGGELELYTQLMVESREEAMDRLKENCRGLGGNAVIACRVTTSNIAPQASEVLIYGTAVELEELPHS